jgi:tetratricopeptide (TPR) repeat protein
MRVSREIMRHVAALFMLVATGVSAQDVAAPSPFELPAPRELVAEVDRLLDDGRADEALVRLETALRAAPYDVELRWRAARAATLLGLLSATLRDARDDYRRAIAHADQALSIAPGHRSARTWSLAAKGRLALWTGARETARLAEEVWAESHALLELDPDHAIAHHALGMLQVRVALLNGWLRVVARLMVGGEALAQARADEGLAHLRRATALEPENRVFGVGLADALVEVGRPGAARAEVARLRALPIRTPLDERFDYWTWVVSKKLGDG